jgi:hypothetical protein
VVMEQLSILQIWESGLVRLNDCDILRMRETARVMPAPAPCEKAARSGAPKT